MHIVNALVPYAERCIFIENDIAVIWPFFNVVKGTDKDTPRYPLLGYERADQCAVVRAVARIHSNAQCHQSLVCIAGTVAL